MEYGDYNNLKKQKNERHNRALNNFAGQKVHLIGIGGISMSAIAFLLIEQGAIVSGSDLKENDKVKKLRRRGAKINIGHWAENISNPDLVVFSSAIPQDNPELKKARQQGITLWQRARMLSYLTAGQKLIAITGTHGKTTTTGMLTAIFLAAERDPTVMLGGDLDLLEGNYRTGSGEYFLTEADESDGSLLNFAPDIAVVTNIELEHLNYYQSEDELIEVMLAFLTGDKTQEPATIILCHDDFLTQEKLLPRLKKETNKAEILTYGLSGGKLQANDISIRGYNSSFMVGCSEGSRELLQLKVPGNYNISNALAAAVAASQAGIDWPSIKKGLKNFSGVKRRFEIKGKYEGITVVDDYAHHPTEIENVFSLAARLDYNQLFIAFQPHRYTRTARLWEDFVKVLAEAPGILLLTEIYSANQNPIPGINSWNLYQDIKTKEKKVIDFSAEEKKLKEQSFYCPDLKSVVNKLRQLAQPGDLIITMGAGDIYQAGEDFLASCEGSRDV